jgi:hypothetical protein
MVLDPEDTVWEVNEDDNVFAIDWPGADLALVGDSLDIEFEEPFTSTQAYVFWRGGCTTRACLTSRAR